VIITLRHSLLGDTLRQSVLINFFIYELTHGLGDSGNHKLEWN